MNEYRVKGVNELLYFKVIVIVIVIGIYKSIGQHIYMNTIAYWLTNYQFRYV